MSAEALAESDLMPVLGFKGGTALKRCHFGDYRFSEDLDFTLTEPIAFDELVRRLDPICAAVREAFSFDREDRQKHDNSYACRPLVLRRSGGCAICQSQQTSKIFH